MMAAGWVQLLVYFGLLLGLSMLLGGYMARVYEGRRTLLEPLVGPLERLLYRLAGSRAMAPMTWRAYAGALLVFNAAGLMAVYALQRLQGWLPWNPQHLGAVPADLALNTAISFATNTNWQSYSGETTLSYLTQMLGLTVQNFLSAATGMAVLVALVRGLRSHSAQTIGNFWIDLTRTVLHILLPLSLLLSVLLVSQGVVQTLRPYERVPLLRPISAEGRTVAEQTVALGPAASQIAIKQLGTNGGGFFGANSAHPLENPTPLSNLLECLAILLIPVALCFTFGHLVGDRRQGWVILAAMSVLFVSLLALSLCAEQSENPVLARLGVDQAASDLQPGGSMEGKEVRFGIGASALWSVATTAAANGSINAMHDSFTPLGGLAAMLLMQLGEVVYGGVGSGLYGMLAFVIIAVFVAGLMVGRTPEYLGKRIEVYEMKMAALMVLIPPIMVLCGTALAVAVAAGVEAVANPGPHGFSEILYAFSSAGNNNGSAFAGLATDNPFYNTVLGLAMLMARYWLIVPALALAGSLAAKKRVPASAGTLPTHTPLFTGWLVVVVTIVGALSFLPALALGPIVEHLLLVGR
ncbi:MAG: potassium-transporting ATPase subunit KdpA [Armatimonadetes bacterium]|nr:potassium-transporting ATPase subunit KdpA [Armatimonadota bacterium]